MSLTLQQVLDGLLKPGSAWDGGMVTFSVPGPQSAWPGYAPDSEPFSPTFATLTAAQAGVFRSVLSSWAAYTNLSISETNDDTAPGQIRVAFVDVQAFGEPADRAGYAYFPGTGARPGDIWLDNSYAGSAFAVGSYALELLFHEVGHTLGLKHSFEAVALPAEYDNRAWTVMSYTAPPNSTRVWYDTVDGKIFYHIEGVNAISPMPLDVVAIQKLYGASASQNGGDDTYRWSQEFNYYFTLRDTGGTDTFDFSAHTRPSIISLTPGSWSSIGYFPESAQLEYWGRLYPLLELSEIRGRAGLYTGTNNVYITPDTVIEKVMAGSGADTITGNDAGDTLSGGAGDDRIIAGNGRNYLRGDDGNDSIVGGTGFDDINGNAGNDTCVSGGGDDWVVGGKGNDSLVGSAGDNLVYGNLGNDTCDGGAGNDIVRGGQDNDSLMGGAGNDFISGDKGDDTVSGGAGADIFHTFGDAGIDRVLDFSLAEGDRVQLDPGTQYTVSQVGADTVISMTGGGQMILVGVQMASLTPGWIFGA